MKGKGTPTTQVDMRVGFTDGVDFQGGRIRESNVLGSGQSVELYYLRRDVTRDYGFGYETPQFFGTRWDMSLVAGRSRAGTTVGQLLAYPFLGETEQEKYGNNLNELIGRFGIEIENATVQDYVHHSGDAPSWILANLVTAEGSGADPLAGVGEACFYRAGTLSQ